MECNLVVQGLSLQTLDCFINRTDINIYLRQFLSAAAIVHHDKQPLHIYLSKLTNLQNFFCSNAIELIDGYVANILAFTLNFRSYPALCLLIGTGCIKALSEFQKTESRQSFGDFNKILSTKPLSIVGAFALMSSKTA